MFRSALAAVLMIAVSASSVFAGVHEYTADIVSSSTGKPPVSGKMYATSGATRYETPDIIAITRWDRNTIYMLMPKMKKYFEQQITSASAVYWSTGFVAATGEQVVAGEEDLNGVLMKKYKLTISDPRGPAVFYRWYNQDVIPVKIAQEDGSWSREHSNIQPGPQPAELFEVPADYEKMVMPAGE